MFASTSSFLFSFFNLLYVILLMVNYHAVAVSGLWCLSTWEHPNFTLVLFHVVYYNFSFMCNLCCRFKYLVFLYGLDNKHHARTLRFLFDHIYIYRSCLAAIWEPLVSLPFFVFLTKHFQEGLVFHSNFLFVFWPRVFFFLVSFFLCI